MTLTDIVTNIDRRLADVQAEVVYLEEARLALVNGSQPASAPKARRADRKPAKPRYQVVPTRKLTALLAWPWTRVSCPSPGRCIAVGGFDDRAGIGATLAQRYS